MLDPTPNVALERPIICPVCGEEVQALGAEDLAFNSGGACPTCSGTGIVRTVNQATVDCGPESDDRTRRCGALAFAHVVNHGRRMPRNGRAH